MMSLQHASLHVSTSSSIPTPTPLPLPLLPHVDTAEASAGPICRIPRSHPFSVSRRVVLLLSAAVEPVLFSSPAVAARERRNRKVIPLEDYSITVDGLKYYDIIEGKGPRAEKGSTVQVHFDCIYRNITALSSRESKLLAGNRVIAQPYAFIVGSPAGEERKRVFVDNPNGLFSAQASPRPPPAMYTVTEGMRVGGKRTVIVPPEDGYGQKGLNEIPPGATFELNIELLQVVVPEVK